MKSILSSLGQCVSSSMMMQASEGKESPKGQSMGPALGGPCTLALWHFPSQLGIWRLNFLICEVGSFAWTAYVSELVLSIGEESRKRFYTVGYRPKRQVSYFIHKISVTHITGKKYLGSVCFREIPPGIWSPRLGYPLSIEFLNSLPHVGQPWQPDCNVSRFSFLAWEKGKDVILNIIKGRPPWNIWYFIYIYI